MLTPLYFCIMAFFPLASCSHFSSKDLFFQVIQAVGGHLIDQAPSPNPVGFFEYTDQSND